MNVLKFYLSMIILTCIVAKPMDAIIIRIGSDRNANLLNAMGFSVYLVKYAIQQFMILAMQLVVSWMMLN